MIKKITLGVAVFAAMMMAGQAMALTYDNFEYQGTLIKYGLRGSQVTSVQSCMNRLGYNVGPEDGIYGPMTYAGIVRFQTTFPELINDGIIGPKTAPFFEQACAASIAEKHEKEDVEDKESDNKDEDEGEDTNNDKDDEKEESFSEKRDATATVLSSSDTSQDDTLSLSFKINISPFGDAVYVPVTSNDAVEVVVVDASDDSESLATQTVSLSSTASRVTGDDGKKYFKISNTKAITIKSTSKPGAGDYKGELEAIYFTSNDVTASGFSFSGLRLNLDDDIWTTDVVTLLN